MPRRLRLSILRRRLRCRMLRFLRWLAAMPLRRYDFRIHAFIFDAAADVVAAAMLEPCRYADAVI